MSMGSGRGIFPLGTMNAQRDFSSIGNVTRGCVDLPCERYGSIDGLSMETLIRERET
jgi:hypothetical protein